MSRRRAIVVLAVVVGGLILLSLSTIVAGLAKAPATYAQLLSGGHGLEVWRDNTTKELTFHWAVDPASEARLYSPKRLTLAQLRDGKVVSVDRYPSRAAAWHAIHGLYGVTRKLVHAALDAGQPSPLPPTAG